MLLRDAFDSCLANSIDDAHLAHLRILHILQSIDDAHLERRLRLMSGKEYCENSIVKAVMLKKQYCDSCLANSIDDAPCITQ